MAAKKRSTKSKSVGLWLGAFSVLESGRGDAAFQIIGRARDAEEASRVFEQRLLYLRDATSLFDAESSVYLDAIIDLTPATFPVPTLVNFVSRKQSAPSDVWSPVPEQADSRAEIYGWGEDDDSEKVIDREPFLEFAKRKGTPTSKAKSRTSAKREAARKSSPSARRAAPSKAKRGK